RELEETSVGDVLRLQMLMTHYRQPIDWTWVGTELAREEMHSWASTLEGTDDLPDTSPNPAVVSALSDDLNTPTAITELRRLSQTAKHGGRNVKQEFATTLKAMGFKEIYSPGLYEDGVQGKGLGASIILVDLVRRLRAARGNGASSEVVQN